MRPSPLGFRYSALVCVLVVLAGLAAAPAAAQQIQVTAADPPTGEQGTVNLNVKITGRGFKEGAQAKWFVTGTTNPGGVTVNSTAFVSSTELTANITIDAAAVISKFDIQVQNTGGRTGKGTELFSVTAKPNSCTSDVQLKVIFAPRNGTTLRLIYGDSDFGATGRTYVNPGDPEFDGGTMYTDGVDDVYAQFQVCNGSNDFVMNLFQSSRLVNLDFSQQITSPDPKADNLAGEIHAANSVNGQTMFNAPLGGTYATCIGGQLRGFVLTAAFKFQNPATYEINGGPCQGGGSAQAANIGGDTSLIHVEHPDVCTWIIRPVADGSGFYRGGVSETVRSKLVSGGQYNLPFAIKLVNKGCQP